MVLEIILPDSQANDPLKKRKGNFPSNCSVIWGKPLASPGHLSVPFTLQGGADSCPLPCPMHEGDKIHGSNSLKRELATFFFFKVCPVGSWFPDPKPMTIVQS